MLKKIFDVLSRQVISSLVKFFGYTYIVEGKEFMRQFVKMEFLAFSRQQKAKCVTWYIET